MNQNNCHQIRRTFGSQVPSLCVFLDTETRSEPGLKKGVVHETFQLAVAIKVQRESGKWNRRTVKRFTRGCDLWDWVHSLESKRKPVWIWGHNVGFDLVVSGFWELVDRGRWSTRDLWAVDGDCQPNATPRAKKWRGCVVVTDPPTIVILRSRQGTIRVVDTFNYFRGSVEDMGRSAGLDKLPLPSTQNISEQLFDRCERDATILERTVCNWIDKWSDMECGHWMPTASGLGYSAWRNTLTNVKVIPDHSDKQIHFARSAYFGGQTEVYYRGNVYGSERQTVEVIGTLPADYDQRPHGPVTHLDVSSLYPSVMRNRYYPRRFCGFDAAPSLERVEERGRYFLPIACVQVKSDTDTYPVRRDGKYMHAVGCFSTFLCGDELTGAIQRGHVVKIHEVAWYEPADLFTRFVDKWLDARQQAQGLGDEVAALLCKLVVNSLTGKLAQRKTVWVERPDLAAAHRFGEWQVFNRSERKLERYRAIAGCVQEFTHLGEGRDSFPAVSAMITANGRERMRYLRSVCPEQSILYQDTDSLFALPRALESLRSLPGCVAPTPGSLRIIDTYTWLDIRGFKFYGHDKGTVCPGLKKDSRVLKPGTWNQSRFQRLADKLNRYDGPYIAVQSTDFTPVGTLGTRLPGNNGWTEPPVLREETLPF